MWQIMNAAGFLIMVIVNVMANIIKFNGKTTAEVSDAIPTLFAPAGYVFAIWGVIYILLGAFAVYQALPRNRERPFINKIGYLFALGSLANVVWLFLWHYEQISLSVIPMFILLGSLIAIYLRIDIGRSDELREEKLCVHLPFSVYLGWITVASIANVAAALKAVAWDGFGIGESTWTVLVIAVALVITVIVMIKRRDIAYGAVIVWALVGIVNKQMAIQAVVWAASASAIVVTVALIVVAASFFTRPSKASV